MSVIKEIKREQETFLDLKVGDNLYTIAHKLGIMDSPDPNRRYDMPKTDHINVDERTKNEFLLINPAFVSKVNEKYALIVKVRQIEYSFETWSDYNRLDNGTIFNFRLDIEYFVLGTDDSGKTFIHYLDSEKSKRVRINEISDSYSSLMLEHGSKSVLNYFMSRGAENFSKYREFTLEQIVQYMNREEAGFNRVQGDVVFKLIKGYMGICKTCPMERKTPEGTFVPLATAEAKMLYPMQQNIAMIPMCKDCIKSLNRGLHVKTRQEFGNHMLASDQYEQFIEIGDTFTFNNTVINLPADTDITEFKESLEPGRMVVSNDKLYVSVNANEITRDGIAAPGVLKWNDRFEKEVFHASYSYSSSENAIRDITSSMWSLTGNMGFGQPRMIIGLGGQNVILEHQQHKDKSVYIPKDHVGVFTFQRTAPESLGAE